MNYFFFDVRALKLHAEADRVGIIITDDKGNELERHYYDARDCNIKVKFAKHFNKFHNNCTLVTDRPFPLKTNFLNLLIDEEHIENCPYFILDLASILFGRKVFNKTILPLDKVMDEIERIKNLFFYRENQEL